PPFPPPLSAEGRVVGQAGRGRTRQNPRAPPAGRGRGPRQREGEGRTGMTLDTDLLAGTSRPRRRAASPGIWLDRQSVFSWLMMAPPLLFLVALVGYPFCYGILLSLQDRPVAHFGTFVGLKNFMTDFKDAIFWRVTLNTFVYTAIATLLKMVG